MEIDEEFYILEQEVYTKKDLRRFLAEGISLEYADLRESELIGANIPKLNLTGANLQGADLRYANLAGAILEKANLEGAHLEGIKLTGANLSEANLDHAKLDNADLVRANLSKASFKKAILTYASLRSANTSETDFSGADLRGANLSGIKECVKARFDQSDLRGAWMEYTSLDEHELTAVGAKVDSYTKGLKRRVFDFMQVEEKRSDPLDILLAPLKWASKLFTKRDF
jgi:uncharacterized protein YjbI with pentapeptide repeats